jgi:hypothetical protein
VVHLNPRSGRWEPDRSHHQRHVNTALFYNIWHDYQATGDLEFPSRYGAEIMLEITRFWASIAQYNTTRGLAHPHRQRRLPRPRRRLLRPTRPRNGHAPHHPPSQRPGLHRPLRPHPSPPDPTHPAARASQHQPTSRPRGGSPRRAHTLSAHHDFSGQPNGCSGCRCRCDSWTPCSNSRSVTTG